MELRVEIQSIIITGGMADPVRKGRVSIRIVAFALVQGMDREAVFHLPLEIQNAKGQTVVKTEAVGLAENRVTAAVAEVSLVPGDYWLLSPTVERPPRGFRVADRFSPAVQLCFHSRRRPSVMESRAGHDARGQLLSLGQSGWIRACCVNSISRQQEGNAYSLAVYVPLSGSLNLGVDGRILRVRTGEYAVVNPSQISRLESAQRWPIRFIRLTMFQSLLRAFRERIGWPRQMGPFQFEGGATPLKGGMRRAIEHWKEAFHQVNAIGAEERFCLSSQLVLHELVNSHTNVLRQGPLHQEPSRRLDERMVAALAVLDHSIGVDWTVEKVAREVGVGSSWLRHRFMIDLREGFADHLRALRMKKAVELLKDRTRSVPEVADAVGYRDLKSFRRAFRKFSSTTPRNQMKTPGRR